MLPIGIIVIWRGPTDAIPNGWALCDGLNGTPDLRDRFVVGAGTTFNPDDTGGAWAHTHTFTSDGHRHELLPGPVLGPPPTNHRDRTDLKTDSGTTDATPNLPPYYALAYIMRI